MRFCASYWITAMVFLAATPTPTIADPGTPIGPDRKLLMWGVNAVDSAYLKAHVAELEGEYAVDGVVIAFCRDDWPRPGRSQFQTFGLFGGRPHRRDEFRETIANLKQTRFTRFTDNFLYVAASVTAADAASEGNLDWFDDRWSVIAQNMALYAEIARDVGFKGLMLDFENYRSDLPLWRCFEYSTFAQYRQANGLEPLTAVQYRAQVRRRGREMIAAVSEAYPDITVLMIPWCSEEAVGRGYDMLPGFIDGVLEGARPRVTLVNALERGYPLQSYEQFMRVRQRAERKGPRHSQIPDVYRRKLRYGFGFWIDFDPNQYGGWHTAPDDLKKNHRSPQRLEHGLHNALTASDQYVWLYVWHPEYFWNPDSRLPQNLHRQQQRQCVQCPHSVMPQAYLDAIADSRRPHDLAWTPVMPQPVVKTYTADELAAMGPNILTNGSFEAWPATADQPPSNWVRGGTVTVSGEPAGKLGDHCLGLTNDEQGHGFVDQRISVASYAGKTVIFGVWCKASVDAPGSLSVLDWVGPDHGIVSNPVGHPLDGRWHFLTARYAVRSDANGELWFRLNRFPEDAGAKAYFDGAVAVVEVE